MRGSERVRARLCSNLIFYYGTTETSTISSAPAYALTDVAGAVGHVAPDVSVRIVDEAGELVELTFEHDAGAPAHRLLGTGLKYVKC